MTHLPHDLWIPNEPPPLPDDPEERRLVEAFGQHLASGEIATEHLETLLREFHSTARGEAALADLGRQYVGRYGAALLRIAAHYAGERIDAQFARAVIVFTRAVLDAHIVCAHCQFPSVLPGLAALAALHANSGDFGAALLYYQRVITEAAAVLNTAGGEAKPGLVKDHMIRPLESESGWDVVWEGGQTARVVFSLGFRGTGGTIEDPVLRDRLVASSIVTFAEWFMADAQVESARIAETRGELAPSFALLQSAEQIDRRIEAWARLGITLNAMGRIAGSFGFHAPQRRYYEAALPFHRMAGSQRGLGNALTNIALSHLHNPAASASDLAEALELVFESLPIHRESGNDDSEVIALHTLAQLIGRAQEARADDPGGTTRLTALLSRRGADILAALETPANTGGSTARSVVRRLRWCCAYAALSAMRGDLRGQIDAVIRYVAEFGPVFDSAFSPRELGDQLNELAQMLLDGADAAARLAERSDDRNDAVRALNFSERARSRQLLRAVVQRQSRERDTRLDELSVTAAEYRAAEAHIADNPTDFRAREAMTRDIVAMAATADMMARDVAALHACLPPIDQDLVDGVFAALGRIGDGLVVLGADVAEGDERSAERGGAVRLVALGRKSHAIVRLDVPTEIWSVIAAGVGPDPDGVDRIAAFFRRRLLAETQVASADGFLVLPHDVLYRVPWERVFDGAIVARAFSLDLLRLTTQEINPPRWRAGAIISPESESSEVTRQEAALAATAMTRFGCRAVTLAGAAATRDAVLRTLAEADVVHIAGHIDLEAPDLPALVVADGLVSLREIAMMPYRRDRLVVVNGCRGADTTHRSEREGRVCFDEATRALVVDGTWRSSPLRRVDEQAGMPSAFIIGGSAAVVAPLTPLADVEALVAASTLYDALGRGAPVGEAVREVNAREIAGVYACYGNPLVRAHVPARGGRL